MVQHFNIGAREEIKPFAHVQFIRLADCVSEPLKRMINSSSEEVTTRKINDKWVMLYPVESMNFTVLIKWDSTDRGSFKYITKSNLCMNTFHEHRVQFSITDDILSLS